MDLDQIEVQKPSAAAHKRLKQHQCGKKRRYALEPRHKRRSIDHDVSCTSASNHPVTSLNVPNLQRQCLPVRSETGPPPILAIDPQRTRAAKLKKMSTAANG